MGLTAGTQAGGMERNDGNQQQRQRFSLFSPGSIVASIISLFSLLRPAAQQVCSPSVEPTNASPPKEQGGTTVTQVVRTPEGLYTVTHVAPHLLRLTTGTLTLGGYGFIQSDKQPFIHTFTRRRQSHSQLGEAGDRPGNLLVTSRPPLPPELHQPHL